MSETQRAEINDSLDDAGFDASEIAAILAIIDDVLGGQP